MQTVRCKLEAGQQISGKKIGLTSKGMQDLLGVDERDYGHLFDRVAVPNGAVLVCKRSKIAVLLQTEVLVAV